MASNRTIGILAHVDAGKTTLSECILYETGVTRKRGRVDHGDAFLDTDAMEKKRGITIYSKMARFTLGGEPFTLLDTPGHVDFSPEMERTLKVLDAAVLVISAPDLVTSQVRVIWKLLRHYCLPAFLFVNKMDQLEDSEETRERICRAFAEELGDGFVPFGEDAFPVNPEEAAVLDDALMERCLEGEEIGKEDIRRLVEQAKLFPVYFGSALQDEGVSSLLAGIGELVPVRTYPEEFGALVYKIAMEKEGAAPVRLSFMKITGGTLRVRDTVEQRNRRDAAALANDDEGESGEDRSIVSEKVSGIRLYSGGKYTAVTEAAAGEIAAVAGLFYTAAGDGLGSRSSEREEILQPIRSVAVTADGVDRFTLVQALRTLEEEEPMLHVVNDELTGDVTIAIMGEVQTQILQNSLYERFGIRARFGQATIVYKESIRHSVEGVGHFEPLRHYAEVHLVLEPTGPGTGLTFENRTPPGMLDKNWQNLIMTHLQEKVHRGVLTGSELTDMRISLIGGRASKKHTEGGDFRRATYRAVRQGLMLAENVLLEPVLSFVLELPQGNLGRAMNDLTLMGASMDPAEFSGDTARLTGACPASLIADYAKDVAAYTGGNGQLRLALKDYEVCHNSSEVIEAAGYDPDADRRNPSYSVFCSHGAGTVVTWDRVRSQMQVETFWERDPQEKPAYDTDQYFTFSAEYEEEEAIDTGSTEDADHDRRRAAKRAEAGSFSDRQQRYLAGEKELMQIFERTYGPVSRSLKNPENEWADQREEKESSEPAGGDPKYAAKKAAKREEMQTYLLVDGYNIIFAWQDLKSLALADIKAARDRLLDILSDYAGYAQEIVIVVFDAYRVPGFKGEVFRYHNIDVVFTKEAETADLYIEKTAHELAKKHRVMVATSDAVEQVIIFGTGALRVSARGLLEQILAAKEDMRRFLAD